MPFPSVDESMPRLRRADWSVGDCAAGGLWLVTGTNGDNALSATGTGRAEAWWRACVQAREAGMLAGARNAWGRHMLRRQPG
jgi:hypothetical protein